MSESYSWIRLTVPVLALLMTAAVCEAQTKVKVLFSFDNTNGALPTSSPVVGAQGNIFGVTEFGGAFNSGVVFKLSPSGLEKTVYDFRGGTDGYIPVGLTLDSSGNIYGTTAWGGSADLGTVFKIDKMGKETVLHSFVGSPTDGSNPQAGLVRDAAGNLYGTTALAGVNGGCGTVFKVDGNGNETILHTFTCGADGAYPYSHLIRDSAGNLYGTTQYGGPSGNGTLGFGTVFMLDPAGQETVLYGFTGGSDGGYPFSDLLRDSAGNLYGTTLGGGTFSFCGGTQVCGTLFKVDMSGIETVLHNFGSAGDGFLPTGGLIEDGAHNLYGTTSGGGALLGGIVFRLNSIGDETVLYNFGQYSGDASTPSSTLIRGPAGVLYGTAGGGKYNDGTIFELKHP